MSKKIFLVDVARCNGCHNCQIACKDEHCGTEWLRAPARRRLDGPALRGRLRRGRLRFGDEADFADELAAAERLDPKSSVYYLNLPARWVAGQVVDPMADEVIIGATVTMQEEGNAEGEALTATTDEFGDFWFRQVEGKKYHLWFDAEGYVERELTADATEADDNIGRVGMYKMIPLG